MSHRILVVDDEPDITALVAYHLAKAGYRVSTAANGPDALKSAREERPDIVILDVMLPGVSGYDVLAELRRYVELRRRKVFVEYVMLAGVNDSPAQGKALGRLLAGGSFKVNLIPYNPTGFYDGSSRETIEAFKRELEKAHVPATVRLTRGRDIAAACGQLAAPPRGRARADKAAAPTPR